VRSDTPVTNFDAIWHRIRQHEGEEFQTKTGLTFTYTVPGAYLQVERAGRHINRSLSKTNFVKAAAQMPVDGPGGLRARQGSSYTWAILSDDRVRDASW
jgi:hypothetical protein